MISKCQRVKALGKAVYYRFSLQDKMRRNFFVNLIAYYTKASYIYGKSESSFKINFLLNVARNFYLSFTNSIQSTNLTTTSYYVLPPIVKCKYFSLFIQL